MAAREPKDHAYKFLLTASEHDTLMALAGMDDRSAASWLRQRIREEGARRGIFRPTLATVRGQRGS